MYKLHVISSLTKYILSLITSKGTKSKVHDLLRKKISYIFVVTVALIVHRDWHKYPYLISLASSRIFGDKERGKLEVKVKSSKARD